MIHKPARWLANQLGQASIPLPIAKSSSASLSHPNWVKSAWFPRKGGKKDKKGGKGKASESDDEDGAPKATSASGAGAGFPELDLKDLET